MQYMLACIVHSYSWQYEGSTPVPLRWRFIAGAGYPEQLVTGGHGSPGCTMPLDSGFWIWIFSTVHSLLYHTYTIPNSVLYLPTTLTVLF